MNDTIDTGHWQQADAAFDRLLDLPAHEREQALQAFALAPTVHVLVLRLLAAHASTDGVLERPLHNGLAPDALAGRRLGGWTLEHELGRGGMAVVYRAHRDEGAQQRVAAVKLLTLGALAGLGPERLRNEHAMLARLNHPHIVPMFDAGAADDGTPWIAMALVDGVHIDVWCGERALDTRAIVRLFLDVCDAVGYAHQNLVIHRDLKPSNVLVDAHGHVRLLDFGISRLAGAADEVTATRQRALTPSYAAPEQFDGAPPATTMDVYGLGALLHRLLVGAPPPREVLPPPLASKTAATNGASRSRVRELRNDIDAVLAKALQGEPAQRYASAGALAADLRRWLSGQPVIATPPATGYRLRKFVARHRFGVAAGGVLALAICGGLAGTLWQARQARLQAAQADAIRDFVLDLFAATHPDLAQGKDPPASLLLSAGSERVRREFSARPAVLAEMLATIGRVQLERGLLDAAESSLDDAIAAFAQRSAPTAAWATAISDRGMLAYERGDPEGAVSLIVQAEQMADAAGLDPADPQRIGQQVRLADMQIEAGAPEAAQRQASTTLDRIRVSGATGTQAHAGALAVLGAARFRAGELQAALADLHEAESVQRAVAPTHPLMGSILNDLGLVLHALRRDDEASAALRGALDRHAAIYGSLHPQTLNARANLANLLRESGDAAGAVLEYQRLIPLTRKVVGNAPHSQLVYLLGMLALAQDAASEDAAALQSMREAWSMYGALPEGERDQSVWVEGALGVLLFKRGDPAAAAHLAAPAPSTCDDLQQRSALTRQICIAGAMIAADAGTCAVPAAAPPDAVTLRGVDRHWWAAWWLLRARCGPDDGAAGELAALVGQGDAPDWLATRIATWPRAPTPAQR